MNIFLSLALGLCCLFTFPNSALARVIRCHAKELKLVGEVTKGKVLKDVDVEIDDTSFEIRIQSISVVEWEPLDLKIQRYSLSPAVLDLKGKDVLNFKGTAKGLKNEFGFVLSQPVVNVGAGHVLLSLRSSKDIWSGPVLCK